MAFLLAESIPFAELKTELLRIEPLVIVASPNHPLAQQSVMHTRDLTDQSVLLPKHDCSYKMVFEQILIEEKVASVTVIELNSVEAIKQCVIKGIGVTIIPMMSVAQEIARQKLAILPWTEDPLETAILMIWHKNKWLSPTLQAFMETVRDVMKTPDIR